MSDASLGSPWSDADVAVLRERYWSVGATGLVGVLNRPMWAIAKKASRLMLRRGPLEVWADVEKVRRLSALDSAYLAGLMDGEGTVSIKGYKSGQVAPYLTVQMTDETAIAWLFERLGGSVATRQSGTRRRVYVWHTERAAHVLEILLKIQPYAVTKREHVAISTEACRLRLTRPRRERPTEKELALLRAVRPLQMKRGAR